MASSSAAAARSSQVAYSATEPAAHAAGLQPYVGPYAAMTALPATLAPAEQLARQVYEGGWRPAYAEGPTRDEVVELIDRTLAVAG